MPPRTLSGLFVVLSNSLVLHGPASSRVISHSCLSSGTSSSDFQRGSIYVSKYQNITEIRTRTNKLCPKIKNYRLIHNPKNNSHEQAPKIIAANHRLKTEAYAENLTTDAQNPKMIARNIFSRLTPPNSVPILLVGIVTLLIIKFVMIIKKRPQTKASLSQPLHPIPASDETTTQRPLRYCFDISTFGFPNTKTVSIRLTCKQPQNIRSINAKIRKNMNIPTDTALFLFNIDGTPTHKIVNSTSPQKYLLSYENKFGGTDDLEIPSLDGDETVDESSPQSKKTAPRKMITALYSNTDGLTSSKIHAIQEECRNDDFIMGNEWNRTEQDAAILANYFGKFAIIQSNHDVTYVDGKRVLVDRKKKGFGTGIVSKRENDLSRSSSLKTNFDKKFEILPAILTLGNDIKIGTICVYRSPSVDDQEATEFYDQVNAHLKSFSNDNSLSGMLYIGDPNKSSNKMAHFRDSQLIQDHNLVNLIGDMPTRLSRSSSNTSQPDSCLAHFDPSKLTISATVLGRLHHSMDHRAIRVSFDTNGVIPRLPKFKTVTYRKRRKDVTEKDVSKRLNHLFESWLYAYRSILFDTSGNPRPENIVIAPALVDAATVDFLKIIEDIKQFVYETQTARWPLDTPENSDHLTVKLAHLSSKLSKLSFEMAQNGTTAELLTKFTDLESKRVQIMREKVADRIDLCMKHQLESQQPTQFDNLFKWTKTLLARNGFLDKMQKTRTPEELEKAMDECDATFTNNDPNYKHDIHDYRTVTPERKFKVDHWDPLANEEDYLGDYISKKKKIDPLYKHHAYSLSNPTFTLLKLIEKTNYFPEVLRTSKMTPLPARFIFSAEALPKIIESVLALEFNECMQADYELNGDPHQMAYEPNRGTTSCNAITFTHVDINMYHRQPSIQKFIDVRKAFNVLCRSLMIYLLHKIAGAGPLLASRFHKRTYIDPNGNIRSCEKHNTGVDAGLPIPVCAFKAGINSDTSLTSKNPNIDWGSVYSDDRSGLSRSGKALQSAIDRSCAWSLKYHHPYHDGIRCCLDNAGVSKCKKFPAVMAYFRRGMCIPDDFLNLKLGSVPFVMTTFQRILGLNVSTDHSAPGYKPTIAKFGYCFLPEVNRIKSLAYRVQDTKCEFIPSFKRMMILCYFCGVLNSAACLYWLRSARADIDRLRYYYGMGIAAIVGETAMGVFGTSCCKQMSVSGDNSRMKLLLDMVGLKSLKDIAGTDAISTVKQVASVRPEWFRRSSRKRKRSRPLRYGCSVDNNYVVNTHKAVEEADLPTQLSESVAESNALIADVWRLACDKVISDYEVRNKTVVSKSVFKYEEIWRVTERVCRAENPKCSFNEILLTYNESCREFLGTDNIQERRLAFLTANRNLRPHSTCKISAPPPWIKPRKRKCTTINCRTIAPSVPNQIQCNPCRICGFSVDMNLTTHLRKCKKCKKPAHLKCIKQLFLVPSSFSCTGIERHLGFDAIELRPRPNISPKPAPPHHRCLICGNTCVDDDARIDCSENDCNYGAHESCAAVLAKVNSIRLDSRSFKCNSVNYYLKPEEVCKLATDFNNSILSIRAVLTKRGKVNTKKYSPRRRRYENPDAECTHCGIVIHINESNHNQAYCKAANPSTPVPSRDFAYIESRIRRVRKRILLDSHDGP